jgi:hypothetical protein
MTVYNEVFDVKCTKQPNSKYGCRVFTSPETGGVRSYNQENNIDQVGSFDNHSTIVNPNCSISIKAHHQKPLTCHITDHRGKKRMMCKGEPLVPYIGMKKYEL